jgi:hypothetical protein
MAIETAALGVSAPFRRWSDLAEERHAATETINKNHPVRPPAFVCSVGRKPNERNKRIANERAQFEALPQTRHVANPPRVGLRGAARSAVPGVSEMAPGVRALKRDDFVVTPL